MLYYFSRPQNNELPRCPNCAQPIEDAFEMYPSVCGYRQKNILSTITAISTAVGSLSSPDVASQAQGIQQLLAKIGDLADEKLGNTIEQFTNNLLVAQSAIIELQSKLKESIDLTTKLHDAHQKSSESFKKKFKLARRHLSAMKKREKTCHKALKRMQTLLQKEKKRRPKYFVLVEE